MIIYFHFTKSPSVPKDAKCIETFYTDKFLALAGELNYSSKISSILICPTIVDPEKGVIPNFVDYRRSEKEVGTDYNIPYEPYCTANSDERVILLSNAVVGAIRQVPNRYITDDDKEKLICVSNEIRKLVDNQVDGASHFYADSTDGSSDDSNDDDRQEIQIVLQWDLENITNSKDIVEGKINFDLKIVYKLEELLEEKSRDKYWVDGHECGDASVNFFLYTENLTATVEAIKCFESKGLIPNGVRIATPNKEESS